MINLGSFSPPKKRESVYLMADYVEMLCLCEPDQEISMNDALTRVYHTVEWESEREVSIEEHPRINGYISKFKDSQTIAAEDWFKHLEYREKAFGDFYPFESKSKTLFLKSLKSDKVKIYISLLLCSSLRLLKNSINALTEDFELLSAKALKNYLPGFTVHHFGKTKNGRKNYPSKLGEAIIKLAFNLNEKFISDLESFKNQKTGDGGLDVVAWQHFKKDPSPGTLICFGQCSCSPDEWVAKQIQSSFDNWRNRIGFVHPPANFMFIPFCFRGSNGEWFNKDKIISSILVDRLRICSLFDDKSLEDLGLFQDVNTFIESCQKNSE